MSKLTAKAGVEVWLDTIEPTGMPARDGRNLRAIGAALTAREHAEDELKRAVRAAHAAGDSWEAIGLVLGTSRQAAHRKYAARDTEAFDSSEAGSTLPDEN
ncbi:hypothetical protein [Cryobacterium glaciale]|uniref:hypothetical protein n=1 Tax=Cryobacterium glaciale TaxID=1259145 RepID=UPI0015819057|nr:hypothetical protein [Cryobacterium glaciale]